MSQERGTTRSNAARHDAAGLLALIAEAHDIELRLQQLRDRLSKVNAQATEEARPMPSPSQAPSLQCAPTGSRQRSAPRLGTPS